MPSLIFAMLFLLECDTTFAHFVPGTAARWRRLEPN